MASRIKMWRLERTIKSLCIEHQNGHWGLGLYSDAFGNDGDPYYDDYYYCFVPYPELEEVIFSLYRLFKDERQVTWIMETVREHLEQMKDFRQKAMELGKQMNACLKGEGSPMVPYDDNFELPQLGYPNAPLERK